MNKRMFKFFVVAACLTWLGGAQAQWVQSGLSGQYVSCFATNGTNLFAGTYLTGVFLSTDNGAEWNAVNNGLGSLYVSALAVLGTDIFAGTWGGGVFLSTDNGAQWIPMNNGLADDTIWTFVVSSVNLFAGTYHGGVYLTTNNGAYWAPVNNGLTDPSVCALTVSGTNIFTGSFYGGGMHLTTDNGAHWMPANNGLPANGTNGSYIGVGALAVSGANVVAGTTEGAYFSSDNGAHWVAKNFGLPDYTNVIRLAVYGANVFAGTQGYGVYLSSDNSGGWGSVSNKGNNDLADDTIYALAVSGTNLFAGPRSGGVWRRPLAEMITGINSSAAPDRFALGQNYPNPFSSETIISYSLLEIWRVLLKVYNSLGVCVATPVNEQETAGTHTATFSAQNLPDGTYFYRLSAGTLSQMKRLVVIH